MSCKCGNNSWPFRCLSATIGAGDFARLPFAYTQRKHWLEGSNGGGSEPARTFASLASGSAAAAGGFIKVRRRCWMSRAQSNFVAAPDEPDAAPAPSEAAAAAAATDAREDSAVNKAMC